MLWACLAELLFFVCGNSYCFVCGEWAGVWRQCIATTRLLPPSTLPATVACASIVESGRNESVWLAGLLCVGRGHVLALSRDPCSTSHRMGGEDMFLPYLGTLAPLHTEWEEGWGRVGVVA